MRKNEKVMHGLSSEAIEHAITQVAEKDWDEQLSKATSWPHVIVNEGPAYRKTSLDEPPHPIQIDPTDASLLKDIETLWQWAGESAYNAAKTLSHPLAWEVIGKPAARLAMRALRITVPDEASY